MSHPASAWFDTTAEAYAINGQVSLGGIFGGEYALAIPLLNDQKTTTALTRVVRTDLSYKLASGSRFIKAIADLCGGQGSAPVGLRRLVCAIPSRTRRRWHPILQQDSSGAHTTGTQGDPAAIPLTRRLSLGDGIGHKPEALSIIALVCL